MRVRNVLRGGHSVMDTPCVLFTGYLDRDGYGHVRFRGQNVYAHRAAYMQQVGEIPVGLEIDHLCRNRACVEALHLEAVTHAENVRRGMRATQTRCKHGHPFDAANTYRRPDRPGNRECRACNRKSVARYKATRNTP